MRRFAQLLTGLLLMGLPLVTLAHEKTVMYDREKPLKITVRPNRFVQLHFDSVIVDANSTLSKDHVMYLVPEGRHHVLELEGKSKDLNGPLYVTTADDRLYRFWLVATGHDSGKIIVRDSIKEAQQVARERLRQQSPEIDPVLLSLRKMWWAQWGLKSPGVTIRPMRVKTIDPETGVEVVTTHRFQMSGLYGFNQRLFNRGPAPVEFDPRDFEVPEGEPRPVTVSFSAHRPGHAATDFAANPRRYILKPGASVTLHLTYEGVRHAQVPTAPSR